MSTTSPRILVIGGGITGLCCAHRLMALGLDPLLVEASPQIGGRIRTLHEGGFEFEAGPNTLLNNSEALIALLDELDLGREVVMASAAAKKRFVLLNGRLRALPMGPISALTSPLLGPLALLGAMSDLWCCRPADVPGDESVASFVRRHFGARVLNNLVGPFLSGVYAGDPERLEVRSILPMLVEAEKAKGSVIRGLIHRRRQAKEAGKKGSPPRGITFQGGLQRLPARLAEALAARVRTGAVVSSLREDDTGCEATLQDGQAISVDRVVIAAETSAAAGLVQSLPGGAGVAADLRAIPSSDVVVFGLAYDRTQVRHPLDGFGYLVGPGNPGPMLGCLFRSSIFPASAPAGAVLLTCFLGGALHDISRERDDRLQRIVCSELSQKLGVQGRPRKVFCNRWNHALPQANRGHFPRRERIEAWSLQGRISIISSGVYGAPLPKCIEAGRAEAERLASIESKLGAGSEERACAPV